MAQANPTLKRQYKKVNDKPCKICGAKIQIKSQHPRKTCSKRCWLIATRRGDLRADRNPNWKGGKVTKHCNECGKSFSVIPSRAQRAQFCGLPCANKAQKRNPYTFTERRKKFTSCQSKQVVKTCSECGSEFSVFKSHAHRQHRCSRKCQFQWRKRHHSGERNPNWNGGVSRLPYPYNWAQVSKSIRKRDGHKCQNPDCFGRDTRLTTHHIDFNKMNVDALNLITLCSSCNSRANFGREESTRFYQSLMADKKDGGGWTYQEF